MAVITGMGFVEDTGRVNIVLQYVVVGRKWEQAILSEVLLQQLS